MRTLLLLSLLTAGAAGAESDVMAEIRGFCSAKWPNNYRMQEHCIGEQSDALRRIRGHVGESAASMPDGEAQILDRCMRKWHEGGGQGHNWRMVDHCFTEQREARERLKR